MDDSLTVVGHEADQRSVPLVHDLREGCRARAHEDLSDAIVELLNAFVGYPKERLRCSLLRLLVREVPHRVLEGVLFSTHRSNFGLDPNFEATHREQELGVVLGVYADERIFPFDGGKGPRKTLLNVPEDGPPQIYVVLDQPIRQSRGQQRLLLYPMSLLLVGSGLALRYFWMRSRASSAVKRNKI